MHKHGQQQRQAHQRIGQQQRKRRGVQQQWVENQHPEYDQRRGRNDGNIQHQHCGDGSPAAFARLERQPDEKGQQGQQAQRVARNGEEKQAVGLQQQAQPIGRHEQQPGADGGPTQAGAPARGDGGGVQAQYTRGG